MLIKTRPALRGRLLSQWLWLAVLVGYTGYFGYLILFNQLENLVSPRLTVFVVLGFVAVTIFAGVQLARLLAGAPLEPLKGGIVLFLLPFVFIPLALHGNSALLSLNRGVSFSQAGPPIDLTTKLQKSVNPFLPPPAPKPAPKHGAIPPDGAIILVQKNYYPAYKELYANPAAFAGRTIHATGFVYHMKGEPADQLIMARMLMWCCAADAVAIGFISESSHAPALKDAQWIAVTGRLGTTAYVDQYTKVTSTVPMIKVTKIQKLKGPDFAFVYPQ